MSFSTTLQSGDALVIVDLQNDFLSQGALPVPGADALVPVMSEYAARFERHQLAVFATRDWHPAEHVSFQERGGPWPAHAVQFTAGAEFPAGLELPPSAVTISKGVLVADEGASAFSNPQFEASLRALRVRRLFVGGLATEHGVAATVRDALARGFEVFLLRDAIRALNLNPADAMRAEAEMIHLGAIPLRAPDWCQRNPAASSLLTDISEVTMLRACFGADINETAVFEFAVHSLPPGRNFLIAAGLEQVLEFLEELHFTDCEIEWLERTRRFPSGFLQSLRGLRFSGDVHAMAEGTIFFPHEPILRITAPLALAQLVETRVTNLLHYPTLVASKAVRCVLAAQGRALTDLGLRRAHGAEAAIHAARACYLAGFSATSDALAAQHFGIPAAGTMTRSFVETAISEEDAFRRFARSDPEDPILLLDTYDAEAGARAVVRLAPELSAEGIRIKGVRLENGDLAEHARRVRRILDAGGLRAVKIHASGNLDEGAIQRLVQESAPIDSFGVGSRLVTSSDVPFLDCDCLLQRYEGRHRRRRREGESAWPGVKQVYRIRDAFRRMECDVVALAEEAHEGEPLLAPVMHAGRRVGGAESFAILRERVARQVKQLPPRLQSLGPVAAYPVFMSERLHASCLADGMFAGERRSAPGSRPDDGEPAPVEHVRRAQPDLALSDA
jgi:nicotinate phosphoribosyltransferase